MEVNFKLVYDDFRQYELYTMALLGRLPAGLRLGALLGLVALAGLAGIFFPSKTNVNPPPVPLQLAVLVAVLILLATVWTVALRWGLKRARSAFESNPNLTGPCTVRIGADGVFSRDPSGEGLTQWPNVKKMLEHNGSTYILIGDRVGTIIPRHAFASDAEADRFFEQATQLFQAAKQQ